ncbi:hypothetical protein BGY98DRAFT_992957, partial [Russula aff. rugulosa BPL654]
RVFLLSATAHEIDVRATPDEPSHLAPSPISVDSLSPSADVSVEPLSHPRRHGHPRSSQSPLHQLPTTFSDVNSFDHTAAWG